MKESKKINIFDIVIIVCTIISMLVSFFAFYISKKTYDLNIVENIKITANHLRENYNTSIFCSIDSFNLLITKWDVCVINNSNKNIAITDYQILNNSMNYPKKYNLINPSSIDCTDSTKLILPFTLEPGKSKRILIEIGIPLNNQIYNVIESKFSNIRDIKMKDLIDTLSLLKTDIFGDNVIPVIYEKDIIGLRDKNFSKNEQTFSLIFETANDKVFTKEMSIYEYN